MISVESAIQAALLPVPARYPGRYLVLIAGLCLAVMTSPPAGAEEKLETITVTASPLTTNPDQYASIIGQVSRDDILRSGGANLADALKDVPGVTGSGFAAGASRPVIRGFSSTRVRLLEDGIGSFDVSDVGPDHGVPIDPLSARKIEVIRGAATLRYGSQAIGGVVNTINNRVPRKLPDDPLSGEVTGSYGTGADTRQGSVLIDGTAGQFAMHADGFIRRADDYAIPGGTQSNSFFRGDGYSFGSSYFFGADDKSRAGASVIHYDSRYGIPSDTTYIDMKQTKGLFGSSLSIDRGPLQTVNIDAGYADYTHSERLPDGSAASTFNDTGWDARVESLLGTVGPFSSAALGLQFQNRDFSALGEGADYLLPTRTRNAAVFSFAERSLTSHLNLQIGARVEHVSIHGTPVSGVPARRGFTPISASAGLLFDMTRAVKLGLTLSSAARAPAQTELFARGPHDGPATFETGDPSLVIERANSLEATVRIRHDGLRFDGSLWIASFDGFIYGRLTGRTCDDNGICTAGSGGALRELFYDQRGATFRGMEGRGTAILMDLAGGSLSATLMGDYVRATFHDGGSVPRIPPWHAGGGLSWEDDTLDMDLMLKYSGRQDHLAFAETPTSGFVSLDMQTTWRPLADHPGVELAVIGHNLTNSVQRDAVALNKDAVILPGRNVRLMVRAEF